MVISNVKRQPCYNAHCFAIITFFICCFGLLFSDVSLLWIKVKTPCFGKDQQSNKYVKFFKENLKTSSFCPKRISCNWKIL